MQYRPSLSVMLMSLNLFVPPDPCQMQDSWKLSEGFVAEEAKALLPHRATGR